MQSATLNIVCQEANVQEVIERAREGEIVYLLPGVYTKQIVLAVNVALYGLALTYPR